MLNQFKDLDHATQLNPDIYYNFGHGFVYDEFRKLGVINLNSPYEQQMKELYDEVDKEDAPGSELIATNFYDKTKAIMMKVIEENAELDKHLPLNVEGEKSQRTLSNKVYIKAPPWMIVNTAITAWSLGFSVYVPKLRPEQIYQYNEDGTKKMDSKGRHVYNTRHVPTSIVPLPRMMVAS